MADPGYTLQYQIWQNQDQQMLSIWEPVPQNRNPDIPFLYQMNYPVDSAQSACVLLNEILKVAGAEKITPYQFSKLNGKIKVMPNPTLKLFRNTRGFQALDNRP
ncbi:hypothetical protein [Prochlorothrix hollandica]|uniref:Uncharacterized protein n=1 Tax=Prochlorothrix hollandica PCC 9006 = CALU 1027 TaxID=317619 RepID=A0A0M2PXY5_PROHO|nr:hypothetical protein [Prochlorothrix hollandica]KKJ01035.1 hypothetical protein PROH_01020 [Prochlorothrix hollandica PCC 9006 = CALU 1027]